MHLPRDLIRLGRFATLLRFGPSRQFPLAQLLHDLALLGGFEKRELRAFDFVPRVIELTRQSAGFLSHRRREALMRRQ